MSPPLGWPDRFRRSCATAAFVAVLFSWIAPLPGQVTETHSVGELIDTYKDKGSILFKDKFKKMRWKEQGEFAENSIRGRGVWVGARNFTDAFGGVRPYFVSLCGFSSEDEGIPVFIERRVRYQKPLITVDDGSGPATEALDPSAVIVPDLISDESIVSQWKTPLGVTITLTTYAYGQPGHDEYIIQEYVLRNTGDMDEDEGPEQTLPLEDFWFALTYMPEIGRSPLDDRYGYVGRNYATGGDSLRVFYHWDGDFSAFLGFDQGRGAAVTEPDDTGDPDPVDGSLRFQQYIGFGILHVDALPHAPGEVVDDDRSQPATVQILWGDHVRHTSSDADRLYYNEMSLSSIIPDADASGFTEWLPSSRIRTMLGFGPYPRFGHGQEIRIVLAAAIGGISTEVAEEIGQKEFKGLINKQERLQVLATGRDSLLQNLGRARIAFQNGFNLPDPPPPPPTLTITAQGGHILLEWSDEPRFTPDIDTGVDDFAGYRVYRSVGTADGPFTLVKTITREQLESGQESSRYQDFDVSRGVVYYYRVTSFDDGSQNWLQPGKSLESPPNAANTARGAKAFSEPIRASEQLRKVRVIPNPYNIFGVLNFPGPPLQRNKILFSNLPPVCTIRIYTVTGDLVATIEHTDGSGDEEWDQITRSNQFVLSGVYIAHIESELGNQIVKFVIVR